VNSPERATLSLIKQRKKWAIAELKGTQNSEVSIITKTAVMQCFKSIF